MSLEINVSHREDSIARNLKVYDLFKLSITDHDTFLQYLQWTVPFWQGNCFSAYYWEGPCWISQAGEVPPLLISPEDKSNHIVRDPYHAQIHPTLLGMCQGNSS